jgi:hypothetical protein
MQQVVQGLIAVGSLSQPHENDLGRLLQSIKVSTADNVVNVRVDYPVDKALEQLTRAWHDKMGRRNQILAGHGNPPQADGKATPKSESDRGPAAPPEPK